MTYREAIQIQIEALKQIYDNCEGLRDAATLEEKRTWNHMRRELYQLWPVLQHLDNTMTRERADMELQGNYEIIERGRS